MAGNRLPLANISVEGPPGFRFGFSLPVFVVTVGLCICRIHGNVCVIKCLLLFLWLLNVPVVNIVYIRDVVAMTCLRAPHRDHLPQH